MVTLQLNNVAPLRVTRRGSIAAPGLFKVARQLAHVQVVGQASHRGQALSSVSLLKVQMHEIVARGLVALLRLLSSGLVVAIDCVLAAKNKLLVLSIRFTLIAA